MGRAALAAIITEQKGQALAKPIGLRRGYVHASGSAHGCRQGDGTPAPIWDSSPNQKDRSVAGTPA
jgi:hypothetical protein